jgi:hypothetical protein
VDPNTKVSAARHQVDISKTSVSSSVETIFNE